MCRKDRVTFSLEKIPQSPPRSVEKEQASKAARPSRWQLPDSSRQQFSLLWLSGPQRSFHANLSPLAPMTRPSCCSVSFRAEPLAQTHAPSQMVLQPVLFSASPARSAKNPIYLKKKMCSSSSSSSFCLSPSTCTPQSPWLVSRRNSDALLTVSRVSAGVADVTLGAWFESLSRLELCHRQGPLPFWRLLEEQSKELMLPTTFRCPLVLKESF